ncbi:MAG: hypothetical protein RI906_3466, partial [Pseudomonadota bacterium]
VALFAKAFTGIVLTAAVLLMPSGILGAWLARRRRRQMAGNSAATEPRAIPSHAHDQVLATDLSAPREQATAAGTRVQARSEADVVLRARGLSKHFSGIKALQGVDLSLYRGEILGLLGPNGSGKSTFINVVSGHYKPTAGSFTVMGQECAGLAAHEIRKRGVSRTYQIPRPFSGLTVLQNVSLAAQYGAGRLRGTDAQRLARECLEFTDLADRADFFPDELNLHQRKFLELARALAARPSVILLDEVLSGLTPAEIASAVQTIQRIRDQGTSIVFVEHVMSAVMALSDRLVVLDQGQVIAEGAPREVMAREPVIRAYLGDDAKVS